MSNPRAQKLSPRRRGAAMVEFALTAPLLITLVFASIEFSRANMLLHTAAISATEGARKGIITGGTADDIRGAAFAELTPLGINEARVLVDPPVITDNTEMVSVGVWVPVNTNNFYFTPRFFLGNSVIKVVSITREAKSGKSAAEKAKKANEAVAKGLADGAGVKMKKNKKSKQSSGKGGKGKGGKGKKKKK